MKPREHRRDRLALWARKHTEQGPTADAIAELEDVLETIARARRGDSGVIEPALERFRAVRIYYDEDRETDFLSLRDETQVYLDVENERVVELLWALLEARLSEDRDDPGPYALRALVDAQGIIRGTRS